MKITVLHIQLMLHYHAIDERYSAYNTAHAYSPAVIEYREQLIYAGLLSECIASNAGYRTTERGEDYIKALKAVQP